MASFSEKISKGLGRLTGRADTSLSLSDIGKIFNPTITRDKFVSVKLLGLYRKIMKSCAKRTVFSHAKKDQIEQSWYDCFENSESPNGLISIIAKAMLARANVTVVYDSKTGIIREATRDEQKAIEADYAAGAKSDKGVIISFKDYDTTIVLMHYFTQIYELNRARSISVNIAAALKLGISKLREMFSNADSDGAVKQARAIATALKKGEPVIVDADDKIDTMGSIDTNPQIVARDAIYSEIAQETGLPVSFISGEPTTGASVLGDADINREADGIEEYWRSIWKPILIALYDIQKISFRQERWRMLESKSRSVAIIESLDTLTDIEKRNLALEILEIENGDKKETA